MDPLWFEFDEHDSTAETCEPPPREFLRLVREDAAEWPCPPGDTYVLFFSRFDPDDLDEAGNPPEHDEMRLVVDLRQQGTRVLVLGASLVADTVRCGELHIGTFAFAREHPGIVPCERTGPVEELAAFAADWLGETLSRPALRYDRRRGRPAGDCP